MLKIVLNDEKIPITNVIIALQEEVNEFRVPACQRCNGILKPHIVFFGDNVPTPRVDKIKQEIRSCDSMLVLGSSLTVFSAFR